MDFAFEVSENFTNPESNQTPYVEIIYTSNDNKAYSTQNAPQDDSARFIVNSFEDFGKRKIMPKNITQKTNVLKTGGCKGHAKGC